MCYINVHLHCIDHKTCLFPVTEPNLVLLEQMVSRWWHKYGVPEKSGSADRGPSIGIGAWLIDPIQTCLPRVTTQSVIAVGQTLWA